MNNEYNRYYIRIRTILGIAPMTIHEELRTWCSSISHSCKVGRTFPWRKRCQWWSSIRSSGFWTYRWKYWTGTTGYYQWSTFNLWWYYSWDISLSRYNRTNHLKLRKVTSRWVPHQLTAEQKKERVKLCRENLAKFRAASWRLCDIITGDETWIYHRQIGHKSTNAS